MALGLIGTKVGMTQVYDDAGKAAPVTVLQLGPCPVLQVRTTDRDGTPLTLRCAALAFRDEDGEPRQYVAVASVLNRR